MEVRDGVEHSSRPRPKPMVTTWASPARLIPAGRERSSSLDGERSWRPASGFASKHQAELEAKQLHREKQLQRARQLQQMREDKRRREEALAKGPRPNDHVIMEEGEWKTVVSHGRRTRNDRRAMQAPILVPLPPGPPPPSGVRYSRSLDGTTTPPATNEGRSLSQDEGEGGVRRRKQQAKRRQKITGQGHAIKLETSNGVPHPSLLGEVMFARRSSLQRLADKLHADDEVAAHADATQRRSPAGRSHSPNYKVRKAKSTPSLITHHNSARTHHHESDENCGGHSHAAHHAVSRLHRRSSSRLDSPRSGNESHGSPRPNKCGDKRDFFFRNLDFEVRNQLQVDEVAEFSVTDFEMATKISEAVLGLFAPPNDDDGLEDGNEQLETSEELGPRPIERVKYPLVVTDGTACVGGNVLSFCDFFTHVNAVENDATRVQMLQHNLHVLRKTNAKCIHASYLDVMLELQQDVVFLDPPWGGPEYKDLERVDLFLGGVPLHEICTRLQGSAKCVVLKVPSNFDDEKFAKFVPGKVVIRRDLKKMHLVLLDFR